MYTSGAPKCEMITHETLATCILSDILSSLSRGLSIQFAMYFIIFKL